MNLDLNTLLEGWPHEPGQIRVRRIRGIDGKEKIQLRLDLGLIQMEVAGRPDGLRPNGFESLLDWHKTRAAEAEAEDQSYTLNGDECGELHQEGVQYYHRYLALFQLEDFKGVVRDTQHNLDLFAFVSKYAEREEISWSFEQFRPYVMMMNTRAKASIDLERGNIAGAIAHIERSRDSILEMLRARPEPAETCPEVEFLGEWLSELQGKRPLSKLEMMEQEMDRAVAAEAYERAAELRDAIRAFHAKEEAPETPSDPSIKKATAKKRSAPAKPKRIRAPKAPKSLNPLKTVKEVKAVKAAKPAKKAKVPKATRAPRKNSGSKD
ncbi:MAG: UvrB/UvrC motif-containing protein [Chthoniobacteraceae bacterium]